MKRLLFLPLILVFLFAQCRKEELLNVSYNVKETSVAKPTYTISYTGDKNGGTNIASSDAASWDSGIVMLEHGQYVLMKVECNDPTFTLTMNIYVNGFLWKTQQFSNPVASASMDGTL